MNKPIRAKISALGTYVPPRLLTNADLERMVDTNNEWILSRVGIRERHIVDPGVATSDLAVEASKKALQQRGLTPAANEDRVHRVLPVHPSHFSAQRIDVGPSPLIMSGDDREVAIATVVPTKRHMHISSTSERDIRQARQNRSSPSQATIGWG